MYNFFSGQNTVGEIPRYVRAVSARGLERQMLSVQIRLKGKLTWQVTGLSPDGKFYAWYTIDIDLDISSKEAAKAKGMKVNE